MKRLLSVVAAIGAGGLIGALMIIVQLGSFAVHIWTTVIAFQHSGAFVGLLSLFLPVGAEVYWFIYAWQRYGILGTRYNICVLALAGAWLLWATFAGLLAWHAARQQRQLT